MYYKRIITALSVACTLAFAGYAYADELKINTKGGLKIESADGDYSMKLSGRIRVATGFYDGVLNNGNSGSDIDFRHVRMTFKGDLKGDWKYVIQLDYKDGGSVTLQDNYIGYTGFGGNKILTIGKQYEPMGLNEMTSNNNLTFIERSAPSNAFAPSRSYGIAFRDHTEHWHYGVGMFRNDDSDGKDRQGALALAFTGRFVYRPIMGDSILHLGIAHTIRQGEDADFDEDTGTYNLSKPFQISERPEIGFIEPSYRINSPQFYYDDSNVTGLEFAFISGPLQISGEFFDASYGGSVGIEACKDANDVDLTGAVNCGVDSKDYDFDGFYVFASWILTGESRGYNKSMATLGEVKPASEKGAWEMAARFSTLDVAGDNDSGQDATIITLAVNRYFSHNVRLGFNFHSVDYDNKINKEDSGNAWVMLLQMKF